MCWRMENYKKRQLLQILQQFKMKEPARLKE